MTLNPQLRKQGVSPQEASARLAKARHANSSGRTKSLDEMAREASELKAQGKWGVHHVDDHRKSTEETTDVEEIPKVSIPTPVTTDEPRIGTEDPTVDIPYQEVWNAIKDIKQELSTKHEPKLTLEPPPPQKTELDSFLGQSGRVTMLMDAGAFTTPVITVRKAKHAVFLFVPLVAETATFMPKTGSEFTISLDDGEQVAVAHLGAYIEIPELGFAILVLQRVGEDL